MLFNISSFYSRTFQHPLQFIIIIITIIIIIINLKVNFTKYDDIRHRVGEWMYSSSLNLKSVLVGVGGQSFSPAGLPPENSPGTHIIIIIIMFITFIQDIYIYIPETNHVSTLHSVGALLYLHFVLHVIMHVKLIAYFYISTFRSKCAVHSLTVSALLEVVLARYVVQTFSERF